jgi:hypothetical protein
MNIVKRGENRRGPTGREKLHWMLSPDSVRGYFRFFPPGRIQSLPPFDGGNGLGLEGIGPAMLIGGCAGANL